MTKPFTLREKLRILVNHRALVVQDGAFVPIGRFVFGTMNAHGRWRRLRKAGCAVKCACGCAVWARLDDIDFDHIQEHAAGGPTVIGNGRPLRRRPCHAKKSAASMAVTGWVTRTRRKLRVREKSEIGQGSGDTRTRSSFPSRGFQKGRRPLKSRPSPQRQEARP